MQFSLRSGLVVVTVLACYLAQFLAKPDIIGFYISTALCLFLPAIAAGGIVYSRDTWRAFWIGCAVNSFTGGIITFIMVIDGFRLPPAEPIEVKIGLLCCHGFAVLGGVAVVGMRWIYTRSRP